MCRAKVFIQLFFFHIWTCNLFVEPKLLTEWARVVCLKTTGALIPMLNTGWSGRNSNCSWDEYTTF